MYDNVHNNISKHFIVGINYSGLFFCFVFFNVRDFLKKMEKYWTQLEKKKWKKVKKSKNFENFWKEKLKYLKKIEKEVNRIGKTWKKSEAKLLESHKSETC